jgi:two-component system, OmpR family, phosphate regulon response regulator PhoB
MADILIIDDERDIVDAIEYNLKKEGFTTHKSLDGMNGFRLAKEIVPDLIILDLMLPGMSGIELCKAVKKNEKTSRVPIIMLTAKKQEVDKVVGLEVGADDYMVKPFSMKELIARVKAILRRYSQSKKSEATKSMLIFGDIKMDMDQHEVTVKGKPIELSAKEFKLLEFFISNKNKVFSRERLLDDVWGISAEVETRTVDVHVTRLREKLGKSGDSIQTVRGFGYKLKE